VPQRSGLYYAREARGMSRSELVRLSGISKQQLSRLENGQIRLRLDHLKPFATPLGYSPEQMLLWGRFPGTSTSVGEFGEGSREEVAHKGQAGPAPRRIPELDVRSETGGRSSSTRETRREGRHTDPIKAEGWLFPDSFVREQLRTSAEHLIVIEADGDSMAPTIASGERVIVDTGHRTPSPDGLYAIRDTFGAIVVKRLQLLRSSRPTRVKIISDNAIHASEEVPVSELEIVGKALCCLKLF